MRSRYALDTGPLLEILLLRFEASGRPLGRAAELLRHLTNAIVREAYEEFLRRRGPFLLHVGVVVEIDRHVRGVNVPADWLHAFRRFLHAELPRLGVEETMITTKEVEADLFAQLGVVDSGLVALAAKQRDRVIVTSDQRLRAQCMARDVRCVFIEELLDEARL